MDALLVLPDNPAADVFAEILFLDQDPLTVPVGAQIAVADIPADRPLRAAKNPGGFLNRKN